MRALGWALVGLLLLPNALSTPSPFSVDPSPFAVEIVVLSIETFFGPESWKDEPPLPLPPGPVPSSTTRWVYSNPYFSRTPHALRGVSNDWGWGANVTFEFQDGSGHPYAPEGADLVANSTIRLGTQGSIPAKLAKIDTSKFVATFDLDGERESTPPLPEGDSQILLEGKIVPRDPLSAPRTVARTTHPLTRFPSFPNLSTRSFPPSVVMGYTEISAEPSVSLLTSSVLPNSTLPLTFFLHEPHSRARIVGGSGLTSVILADSSTDERGALSASVQVGRLLFGPAGATPSGFVLLEAHLVGNRSGRVAHSLLVVPVTPHVVHMTGISYTPRSGGLDTLRVTFLDRDSATSQGSSGGTLYALKGGKILQTSPILPSSPSAPTLRQSEFSPTFVGTLGNDTVYELLGLLSDSQGNFYGMAGGERGLDVWGTRTPNSTLRVTVRNLNDNGDDVNDEGLSSTVFVRWEAKGEGGGGGPVEKTLILAEAGWMTWEIPLPSEGSTLFLNATMDELFRSLNFTSPSPPPPQGSSLRIPFPLGELLLLAGPLALLRRCARACR